MSEHTKTPWHQRYCGIGPISAKTDVCDEHKHFVAGTRRRIRQSEVANANAAFIVRACNAHEDLRLALLHALPFINLDNVRDEMIAAIAKADGKS